MYTIVTPEQFLRQARTCFRKHPELKPRFAKVLGELQTDPFQPHLELHPPSGKLAGCHAVSLAHRYRITLTLLITAKEIILLDVGSHDEDTNPYLSVPQRLAAETVFAFSVFPIDQKYNNSDFQVKGTAR